MDRAEAEAIYDQGREVVVKVLLKLSAQNEKLIAQVEALTARVARQDERIAQLERRLNRSSRNSSLPPSSDPPSKPPTRAKDSSGRKQGAQKGHEGHGRPLLPAWAVDRFVDHWPKRCRCGHAFARDEHIDASEPVRWQVEELPAISVKVMEHRSQRVRCPACGEEVRDELPHDVTGSAFGPRYQAAVATLSVRNRISRRDVVELCEQLFSSRISAGTVEAILSRTADALAKPHAELLEELRSAAALNIAPDRHENHAKDLLADTEAIITSDRWWAYAHLPLARRQICWAHLRRDFRAHAEGLAAEKEFGEVGLELCDEVFWAWEVFQHTSDRRQLKLTIRRLQRTYKPIITSFSAKRARNKRCRGMARNLLKAWPALWTFAFHSGVAPDNNHAERSLRSAVIYRKLSFGSQSEGGEQRIERLLSAHTTCRLQKRSLFLYLADALAAHARGDPVPLRS